jgi:hypothetical protein
VPGELRLYPDVPQLDRVHPYGRVEGPHSNEVEYVIDDDGNRWVLKRNMLGYNSILAEAVGLELSRLLGIQTPSAGLLVEPGQHLWMTRYLPDVKHWSLDDRHLVKNLPDIGGMLVLDIVVGNEDRHAGNILLQAKDRTLTAFSIDMEQSWAGTPEDISERPVEELPKITRGFARLLPMAELEAHMLTAAQRCESWTEDVVGAVVQPWCNLLEERRGRAIINGLCVRAGRATQLTQQRVQQIRSLQ